MGIELNIPAAAGHGLILCSDSTSERFPVGALLGTEFLSEKVFPPDGAAAVLRVRGGGRQGDHPRPTVFQRFAIMHCIFHFYVHLQKI